MSQGPTKVTAVDAVLNLGLQDVGGGAVFLFWEQSSALIWNCKWQAM